MNYYLVIPLTYIGKESASLTYESESEIDIGMAVKIPLRNKDVLGVVLDKTDKPSFETKEIKEIYLEKPIISNDMLTVAKWISSYYAASITSVLQTMIPSGFTKKRRGIVNNIDNPILENFPNLSIDQRKIVESINSEKIKKPHLIFGVTGSGKTEIYMNLIKKALDEGKGAIILVPEISLTPQALERYTKRFGSTVTILHSNLKETERFANWKAVFDGEKSVVIGSRSALFAPIENLGLIVIDEEHENTYKQDRTPRYQAAKVAEKISELTGAKLVLGSATPKIESYYKAQKGEYFLHSLSKRFVQTSMPTTEIIDLRNEFKAGNKSIFSESLRSEMDKALYNKRQVLLFINRRGMSTFVSCRDCGFVEKCPNCDTSLTFHYEGLNLTCHHCGFSKRPEVLCPTCKSSNIKYFGTGTQRVENELKKIYGNKFSIDRMDADTTKTRGSHEGLYNNFAQNRTDILIGTQMISKGWDLPNVGLIGIITADTMINFPDYSAAERTFDLITQVAGRTGRGKEIGKVVIQTYNPDYPAIISAAGHDFVSFYNQEIINRKELNYPPFANMIKIVYNNLVQKDAENQAAKAKEAILCALDKLEIEYQILGPSPAFIPKLNKNYYYQMTIKLNANTEKDIIKIVATLNEILKNNWSIDVDPSDLL